MTALPILTLDANDPIRKALLLGSNRFPGLWRFMLPPELRTLRFPKEEKATCAACPKICEESYRADYRCCTYHPRVANFLLGLASLTSEGEQSLDRIIAKGMLLPDGMQASPRQWLDFMDDREQELFGQSQRVLCPLLESSSGLCTIHNFRNAVCSTYFCIHDQGESGELFWAQLQTLGSQVELSLAQWALREIGFDYDAYLANLDTLAPTASSLSDAHGWRDDVLDMLWGSWRGREKELCRMTAERVVSRRDELWEIAQREGIREAHRFEAALDALLPDLAEEEVEAVDLESVIRPQATWQACLAAYAELWEGGV